MSRTDPVRVIHGDSRQVLRDLADASIDSCVTDPPYALVSIFGAASATPAAAGVYARSAGGFMGKKWDTGETAFDPSFWGEVLRVLKPGAHLVAFGGTRTYHRLVCAIEDAGFEIRDQLAWIFGSGFPKSHDVSKGIDRAAGAEREVVGQRKTMKGDTGAQTYAALGEFQKSRFVDVTAPATEAAEQWSGWGSALKPAHEPICLARKPLIGTVAANVLQHGTGAINIDASRIAANDCYTENNVTQGVNTAQTAAAMIAAPRTFEPCSLGRWPANVIHDGSEEVLRHFPNSDGQQRSVGPLDGAKPSVNPYGDYGPREPFKPRGDAGSAARFFYSAKADADDRLGSRHPTVKPVDLMAYLIKLVTPPGGLVLDPFAGSGSTGMACMREGFKCTLIEREAEYIADIKNRIAHVRGDDAPLFTERA